MLDRLFRPRWRHADADVRRQAVTRLEASHPRQRNALQELAWSDPSLDVRVAAIARLNELPLLTSLRKDSNPTIADAALSRLAAVLSGQVPGLTVGERQRLLTQTQDQPLLAQIAEYAPDPECREQVLARISDENLLLHLAVNGPDTALRSTAADRIQKPELLRRLVREARDKKVAQRVRQRVKTLLESGKAAQEARERVAVLLEQLQRHAARTPDALYGPQLETMEHSWRNVAAHASDDQAESARRAINEAHRKISAQQEAEARAAEVREAHTEQQEALSTLASLRRDLQTEHWDDLNTLRALVATQQRRWEAAADVINGHAINDTTAPQTDPRLTHDFEEITAFWRETLALAQTLAEATDEEGPALLAGWPADVPPPSRWAGESAAAEQPAPTRGHQKRTDPELHRALNGLRGALQARQLKKSNRLWRKVEALIEEQDDTAAAARLEKLRPLRDELRDWHSFAATPHKEELCQRMETLVEEPMPPEEKAGAIQALQDEWHELMSGDRDDDQAMWDRFHAATENAWEPCREHFRELDAIRTQNLEKRREIVAQLADFIDGLDWANADWPRILDIRRQAPQDWKACQPVAFRESRDISRRFSELLRELDDRMQAVSDDNRAKLEGLVQQAEALADSDDPSAAEQYKAMQDGWRRTGWVFPGPYRALNRRFRKAGDRLFARRKAAHEARVEADKARAEQLQTVLDKLETTLDVPVGDVDFPAAEQLLAEAREIAGQNKALEGQLRRGIDSLSRMRRRRSEWQTWQALNEQVDAAPEATPDDRQHRFAVAVELAADVATPEEDQALRSRYQLEQLQSALKGGAVKGPERVRALFEEHAALIKSGLAPEVRARVREALHAVQGK